MQLSRLYMMSTVCWLVPVQFLVLHHYLISFFRPCDHYVCWFAWFVWIFSFLWTAACCKCGVNAWNRGCLPAPNINAGAMKIVDMPALWLFVILLIITKIHNWDWLYPGLVIVTTNLICLCCCTVNILFYIRGFLVCPDEIFFYY